MEALTIGGLVSVTSLLGGIVWAASRQVTVLGEVREELGAIRAFMGESRADRQDIRERVVRLEAVSGCPALHPGKEHSHG